MQIVSNNHGVYRIQPGLIPARSVSASPTVQRAEDAVRVLRRSGVAGDTDATRSRSAETAGPDPAGLTIKAATADSGWAVVEDRFGSLVAGRVKQPISFAPPASNHILDRAYLRHQADNAGLNEGAVRHHVDVLA